MSKLTGLFKLESTLESFSSTRPRFRVWYSSPCFNRLCLYISWANLIFGFIQESTKLFETSKKNTTKTYRVTLCQRTILFWWSLIQKTSIEKLDFENTVYCQNSIVSQLQLHKGVLFKWLKLPTWFNFLILICILGYKVLREDCKHNKIKTLKVVLHILHW